MSSYSHQEDQCGDEVLNGLDEDDLCNQDICNSCMMKQFAKEGSPCYLNVETVHSTPIRCVPSRLRLGGRLGNQKIYQDVGVVIVSFLLSP